MPDWTSEQLSAITTGGRTLLVSAAAGSGKTATLTERIIRKLINDRADISKMLIVTFTRNSATDLRNKIAKALKERLAQNPDNAHLTSQLIKLGSAHISTIDAFYLTAIRKSFATLKLPSHFRVADPAETDLIARNVMNDTVLDFFGKREDFSALCECFEASRETEDVISKILLSLYRSCMSVPKGIDYVRQCADEATEGKDSDFLSTKYGGVIRDYLTSSFTDMVTHIERALEIARADETAPENFETGLETDRMLCLSALGILKDKDAENAYTSLSSLIKDFKAPTLKKAKNVALSERAAFCQELHKELTAFLKDVRENYLCYSDKDFAYFLQKTADNLALIYEVLKQFEDKFTEEKQNRGALDFTDIKRYALKLFVNEDGTPTKTAREYSTLFTEIYIDEYQDVDPVQDAIFTAISTPTNRFMVGDIKQSIYGFRGAEPSLFSRYRKEFAPITAADADASKLFMSKNFRCSRPVISFSNLVCKPLFSACGDVIGYTEEDDLQYGLKLPEDAWESVRVAYFAKEEKHKDAPEPVYDLTPAEAEAEYVADQIEHILKHGRLVQPRVAKDGNGGVQESEDEARRILPCEIAILCRKNSYLPRFASALTRRGIKTNVSEAREYFQNPDVLMVLCILNAVDNPQRDVFLAGAMRSPIFNFSLEDVLCISKLGTRADSLYDKVCISAELDTELGKRCRAFNAQLTSLREASICLPVDKFLNLLFSTDSFVASGLFSEKSSSGEGGNLLRLYEYARSFEAGSFKGLYNFIEFINMLIDNNSDIDSSSSDGDRDSVTLTTIHGSKGLEYPVCFVSGTGTSMTKNAEPPLAFAYGIGIAMDLADNTGFAHYASPLKKILGLYDRLRSLEEEMRVLYVALTRAREQLYVTGSYSRKKLNGVRRDAAFNARIMSRYSIMSSSSMLDWMLAALEDTPEYAKVIPFTPDISRRASEDAEEWEGGERAEDAMDENVADDAELTRMLSERYSFKYPHAELRRVPAKLSVSELSPTLLDEHEVREGDTALAEKRATVPDVFLPTAATSSAAERGTATHQFLQFCDFAYARKHGVDEALRLLIDKRFIPAEYEALIFKDEIQRLIDGDTCDMILSAERVIREQRFNMLLPASRFTRDPAFQERIKDEKIAVQGVIDLLLIGKDGGITLIDYKTDRLTREQLASYELARRAISAAHSQQLSYYAEAVRLLFGRKPDRVAIYSTHSARLYDIL